MNIIVRNSGINPKHIKNVRYLTISSDVAGICIEVDNYTELFIELDKEGFKPKLEGRLIVLEATALSVFD